MSIETSESTASPEVTRAPGAPFWAQGDRDAKPLLIRQGVVAYRRGNVAIGFLGPGQIAFPVPGVPSGEPAAAELVSVTETVAAVMEPEERSFTQEELGHSSVAVITGAGRRGYMSLPQRLAALLLA